MYVRNPFETFVFGLGAAASVPLIQGESGSRVVEEQLSNAAVTGWGLTVLIGSLLGLVGLFWRDRHMGWVIERAGCLLFGLGAVIYAGAVFESADRAADVAYIVAVNTGFAAACVVRVRQLTRFIRYPAVP